MTKHTTFEGTLDNGRVTGVGIPKTRKYRALITLLEQLSDDDAPAETSPNPLDIDFTELERELLYDLLRGLTYAQIAEAQNYAEHTVRNRLSALYQKMGAQNARSAVYKALQWGVIEFPVPQDA